MMIEINKKAYMKEAGELDREKAGRLRVVIQSFYEDILDEC